MSTKATRTTSRTAILVATAPDRFFDDFTVFSRCAENTEERQVSLQEALNHWASEDIKRIERIDTGERCGWGLWRE